MAMSDPIADYLTRIRNAAQAQHRMVDIPSSKIKREITQILFDKKYIKNFTLIDDGLQGLIRVYLKYDDDNKSIINGLKRISRPGLRSYTRVSEIPRVRNNLGFAILSTPKGVMTNIDARKNNVGGEVLFYIW